MLDKESADIDLSSVFSAPHALNTMASPYQRALTVGMNNNLEVKATAMLKRVGLRLVKISYSYYSFCFASLTVVGDNAA